MVVLLARAYVPREPELQYAGRWLMLCVLLLAMPVIMHCDPGIAASYFACDVQSVLGCRYVGRGSGGAGDQLLCATHGDNLCLHYNVSQS